MLTNTVVEGTEALDLTPIKRKLMHAESGAGWSGNKADAIEIQYRRFLLLLKKYPNEQIAPSEDVDEFWHYHILDTLKYARDCEEFFGHFLHHYPYFGMADAAEEQALMRAGNRMRDLYEAEFGSVPKSTLDTAAWCVQGDAAANAGGNVAWCVRGTDAEGSRAKSAWCVRGTDAEGSRSKSAWCVRGTDTLAAAKPAWCVRGSDAVVAAANSAWCVRGTDPVGDPAKSAWCVRTPDESPGQAKSAWCVRGADTPAIEGRPAWCVKGNRLSSEGKFA